MCASVDCTPRYVSADPFLGSMQAVCEAYRNIISVGSTPLAITNNLNFGNPEKKEIMGQIVHSIKGISEASLKLNMPIISGNVSLYNETNGKAILPTPVIGAVGIIDENPMPIVEILPKNRIYDYKCKYTAGMSDYNCPADIKKALSEKIMRDSVKIFKLLGCKGYGRIDFIIDKNENYYFLEINTLPGMTSTSLLPIAAKAQGLSFSELVKKIIDLGLKGKNLK